MRILVVGASGYIGGRLVPRLAAQGHELILMSCTASMLAPRFPEATVVFADLVDPARLPMARTVSRSSTSSHTRWERGFADDREAARNFGHAARSAGV